MTTECVKDFNNILSSFLIQVSGLIGTTYSYHLNKIIENNSLLPIEQFLVYAIPYRDKILNRDESYFDKNSSDYKDDIINKVSSQINEFGNVIKVQSNNMDVLDEILRLKNVYYSLDNDSKKNLWDILQAMLVLSEDYFRLRGPEYFIKNK
jgi:hypothetical protein